MQKFIIACAPCACCGTEIRFNPSAVPSIQDRPVCEECMSKLNTMRELEGLAPVAIAPDAYEPCWARKLQL
jgi:hypothetical protein